ncbi:hypothetical protein [Ruminococcus sp.]|uniref:hypothetical protein n=1 Tax=Ruminococcus sp. TaxID=41978 RepID=UPI00258AADB8|nr:hypothetical protein [Ruminococcus sp.]MCR5020468.1 hypothetical protein [Ruminococcus sp.]
MGRSLNINHVLNADKLTKAQFKKQFTDMMKAKGYTSAKEEDAELCYELVFSADRKWVTILFEDDTEAKNKASAFARDLGMQVLSVELVDSDFAELTLFGINGAPVDTMFLGEPYFDEVSEPSPLKWQTMLGIDWAKVEEIQQGDHTFAEDALCEFGEIIGCENMLAEYGNEGDNAVRVYFKKAGEKKLTYRTAYNKVFSEVLEPLGFVKTQTPLLYMRSRGDIIDLIKIEESRKDVFSSGEDTRLNRLIDVCFVASTLYEGWLERFFTSEKNTGLLVGTRKYIAKNQKEIEGSFEFVYDKEDPETLRTAVEQSVDYILKYVIPLFDEIIDVKTFLKNTYKFSYSGDLFPLYFLIDDHHEFILQKMEEYYERAKKDPISSKKPNLLQRIEESSKELEDKIKAVIDDRNRYNEFLDKLSETKIKNLEYLKKQVIN